MEKTLPIIFLSLLLFVGCKDGGQEVEMLTETDFVGSWTVAEFSGDYNQSGTFLGNDLYEEGQSSISDSDLQLVLADDGTWTSRGEYTLTVSTEDDRQVTRQEGVGEGDWSYQDNTLFIQGLRNLNGSGFFRDVQNCNVMDYALGKSFRLTTAMDATEANDDYGINIRTRGEFVIQLEQ